MEAARFPAVPPLEHLSALKDQPQLNPPTQTRSSSADTGRAGSGAGSHLRAPIGWLAIKAARLPDGLPAGGGADPAGPLVQAGTPSGCSSVEEP